MGSDPLYLKGVRPRLGWGGFAVGLDEGRLAAFGERDVDRIEVARGDRVREDRAGLVADVAREVARGEVGQREQADVRVARDLGRLAGGRVRRLARALALVLE